MRRVRSQLNNLATTPPNAGVVQEIQRPLGYNHHTDEVQRRIETMGVLPGQPVPNQPMEQIYASQMHQGNVMPNQPQYPMQNPIHPPHQHVSQQGFAPLPHSQTAPVYQPNQSIEMDNIKASLERLTHKLKGLTHSQTSQTAQSSHLQQATSRISEQYHNISDEMKRINQAISNLSTSQSQSQSAELAELKAMLAQQQDMFKGHIADSQQNQIDPNAYATAVEVSHANITNQMDELRTLLSNVSENLDKSNSSRIEAALNQSVQTQAELFQRVEQFESRLKGNLAETVEANSLGITNQVAELRSMLDYASSNLVNASPSNIEATVNQAVQHQAELLQRVEQFEANLNGSISATQNDILNQINAMQQSVDALQTQSGEQFVLDTSSLDSHLEEINRAIVALSSADNGMDNLERIEARISDLGRMLDESQKTPVEQAAAIDTDLISSKFDAVNSAIEQLGSDLSGRPSGDQEIFDGLAAKINKLSEKLDNIPALPSISGDVSDEAGNSALLERLDQLVDRLDIIEAPAFDVSIFNSIQDQIGDMSNLIKNISASDVSGEPSEDANAVMEQLKYISSTVYQVSLAQETGETGSQEQSILVQLGSQIDTLSNQISNFSGAGFTPEALSPISDRLVGIEQQLGASRDIAIELATQAAQEAVENTVSQMQSDGKTSSIDMAPIQQLSEQVQHLKEASDSMNSSNIDTIDTVKDIFSMMAERLSNIESQVMHHSDVPVQSAPLAAMTVPAEESSRDERVELDAYSSEEQDEPTNSTDDKYTEEAYKNSQDNHYESDEVAPEITEPSLDAPNDLKVDNAKAPEISADRPAEETVSDNDMPIEPGTGGPDLALLVRQAKERRSGMHPEVDRPSSGGNQFRQIAKDAMRIAEAEDNEEVNIDAQASGNGARLAKFTEKNKRPLIIGAAAFVLFALSVPLALSLFSNSPQTAASIEQVQPAPSGDETAPLGDTSIESSDELSALQSENTRDPIEEIKPIEENINTVSDPVQSDDAQSGDSQADLIAAADEDAASATQASAGNSLFSGEATSAAEGFGVEPVPAAVTSTDIPFGNDALKSAVSGADPKALFEVGRRYTDGVGVTKDLAEAATWYERAAEQGFAPAQYIIGNFYEKGIGVDNNAQKAATWYETAANNGNVIAMHNLAVLYATPAALSEEPDMATAFEWFKKAASHGVRDSQVNAGIFHTNGAANGETDLIEAYKWFAVAGDAGDKDAVSKRDIVANAMRPDQREQAKQVAIEWKPEKIDRDANEVKIPDEWKDAGSTATAPATIDKSTVKLVQSTLAKLGFDAGPADGVMGSKTRNAISAFQKQVGMPQNGKIDSVLVQVLKKVSA